MIVGRATLRLGTRGSALALDQTRRVAETLVRLDSSLSVETAVIHTAGDRDKHTPLTILGGQGVFARELQAALRSGAIDLAVHSAKDLPSEQAPGLVIAAFLDREDPRDVLVSRDGSRLADLPAGARVGTSSRRRLVALRDLRPDLTPVDLRGNLDTRLRKVAEGEVDAAILAAAGIVRMGWASRISEKLSLDDFVPAPGQGALAVECRADDGALRDALAALADPVVTRAVEVERAFLAGVGGGCRSPIGAHAVVAADAITLRAMVADESLSHLLRETRTLPTDDATASAAALAREMRDALARTSREADR